MKKDVNFRQVARRYRRMGEVPTIRHAVRNHCLSCCGWNAAEVRRCEIQECWLWPWRMSRAEPVPNLDGEKPEFFHPPRSARGPFPPECPARAPEDNLCAGFRTRKASLVSQDHPDDPNGFSPTEMTIIEEEP